MVILGPIPLIREGSMISKWEKLNSKPKTKVNLSILNNYQILYVMDCSFEPSKEE